MTWKEFLSVLNGMLAILIVLMAFSAWRIVAGLRDMVHLLVHNHPIPWNRKVVGAKVVSDDAGQIVDLLRQKADARRRIYRRARQLLESAAPGTVTEDEVDRLLVDVLDAQIALVREETARDSHP